MALSCGRVVCLPEDRRLTASDRAGASASPMWFTPDDTRSRPGPGYEGTAAGGGYPRCRERRIRAGLPATVAPGGTSRVTTPPAPTIASSPIVTPGRMIAPPPIQTLYPLRTGFQI